MQQLGFTMGLSVKNSAHQSHSFFHTNRTATVTRRSLPQQINT
jgi:hypothetical protein